MPTQDLNETIAHIRIAIASFPDPTTTRDFEAADLLLRLRRLLLKLEAHQRKLQGLPKP